MVERSIAKSEGAMMDNKQQLYTPFEITRGDIPNKIQLLPAGQQIRGKDGRLWRVNDPYELARLSNEYMQLHCIDENHATDLKAGQGGAAPAFGWFSNITVDSAGALWADVEWTERGLSALQNKDYRYVSPVFSTKQDGSILLILRAALTNTPNLDLIALNAAQQKNDNATAEETNDNKDEMLKTLTQELNLPSDCTFTDIIEALRELKKMVAAINSTVITTLTQRTKQAELQLNAIRQENQKQEGAYLVNEAVKAGKITPAAKNDYIALCATYEGLQTVKSIIEKAVPIISNTELCRGEPPALSKNEDDAFLDTIGYTPEKWQTIQQFAEKAKK